MNLDALGNIGDFLGGVGVIVTLVYLATQIRQNTSQLRTNAESLRSGALDETMRSLGLWQEAIVSRQDVADLWRRGLTAETDLDETELLRFEYLATRLTHNWLLAFRRARSAQDRDHWRITVPYVRLFMRSPGFENHWKMTQAALFDDADFVAEVDRIRSEASADQQDVEPG